MIGEGLLFGGSGRRRHSRPKHGNQPGAAALVVSVSITRSSQASPPNIGHNEYRSAPGDPETEGRYPIGDNHRDETS